MDSFGLHDYIICTIFHSVVAGVRDPAKLSLTHDKLKIVKEWENNQNLEMGLFILKYYIKTNKVFCK
jgi:hypothetical protein